MPRVAIDLIAVTELEHDGRTIAAGECFTAAPIHAAALTYQRKATFATKDQLRARDLRAAQEAATRVQEQPVRRRYRRRDMTAEK